MEQKNTGDTAGRELVVTRVFNAPRDLVFEVWTRPEHIDKWWGPTGFINTTHEMKAQEGGIWRYNMHAPDGTDFPHKVVYTKVVQPQRLEFIMADENENANPIDVTVIFEELGDKTSLTMRMVLASAEELRRVVEEYGAVEGNKQTMDRLEAYLATVVL